MSSSNRVRLSIIREVTKNVTPATPAFKILRWLSEDLSLNIENVQSEEIRDDRTKGKLIQLGYDTGGDVTFEFSMATFDVLMEGVMCALATGSAPKTFINGTTVMYHTIMKQFLDLSSINQRFTGVVVDKMSLEFKKRAKVTGSFSLMGMSYQEDVIAGSTFTGPSTNPVINTSSHVTSILMDGVPMTTCIDRLSLQIMNNMRATTCVGNKAATEFVPGDFDVSGALDLYFKDLSMFTKYQAGTPFSLAWTITDDAGKIGTFTIPVAQFETLKAVAGGGNQDVMASGTFKTSKGATYVLQYTSDAV
jgi:hypothetical protein